MHWNARHQNSCINLPPHKIRSLEQLSQNCVNVIASFRGLAMHITRHTHYTLYLHTTLRTMRPKKRPILLFYYVILFTHHITYCKTKKTPHSVILFTHHITYYENKKTTHSDIRKHV